MSHSTESFRWGVDRGEQLLNWSRTIGRHYCGHPRLLFIDSSKFVHIFQSYIIHVQLYFFSSFWAVFCSEWLLIFNRCDNVSLYIRGIVKISNCLSLDKWCQKNNGISWPMCKLLLHSPWVRCHFIVSFQKKQRRKTFLTVGVSDRIPVQINSLPVQSDG